LKCSSTSLMALNLILGRRLQHSARERSGTARRRKLSHVRSEPQCHRDRPTSNQQERECISSKKTCPICVRSLPAPGPPSRLNFLPPTGAERTAFFEGRVITRASCTILVQFCGKRDYPPALVDPEKPRHCRMNRPWKRINANPERFSCAAIHRQRLFEPKTKRLKTSKLSGRM